MQKWEYKVLCIEAPKGEMEDPALYIEGNINGLGREGWELTTVNIARKGMMFAFFKRPLVE